MRPHTVLRNFTPVVQKNKFEKNKNPTQYTWRHQRLLFGFTPTLCADVLLLTSFKPFLSIRTYWAHCLQAAPRSSERSNLYEVYQSVYCQIQSTETGRTQTVHIIVIYIWTPSVEIRCVTGTRLSRFSLFTIYVTPSGTSSGGMIWLFIYIRRYTAIFST